MLLGSEDRFSGGLAVALEGLRDWVSVESNGDGKVAGPVMCNFRLWRIVGLRESLERARNDERGADMVLMSRQINVGWNGGQAFGWGVNKGSILSIGRNCWKAQK